MLPAAHAALVLAAMLARTPAPPPPGPVVVRVATFNLEDVRSEDLLNAEHPRLRRLAEVIQRIRPNIILLNEIAYDAAPEGKDGKPGGPGGLNGQRFADAFLARPQATDLAPLKYRAYMAPSNTGLFSGLDLDRDGRVTNEYPTPPGARPDGSPGEATEGGRAFGNDCFGFGTFPGQYAMALLVDERLTIDAEHIRTFQLFPWDYMPGAFMPVGADGKDWYPAAVKEKVRLSSKSIWDVPVTLPNGAQLHVICSHPTPPAFDGAEQRNRRRNHDEIRFLRDYIDNQPYLVDDLGLEGGMIMRKDGPQLNVTIPFVILGDLNADPKDGDSFKSPITNLLFKSRHINAAVTPESDVKVDGLDPWDTSAFKLRVDYVLPGKSVKILDSGVWRTPPVVGAPADKPAAFPSDHYPVWMEIEAPAPEAAPAELSK